MNTQTHKGRQIMYTVKTKKLASIPVLSKTAPVPNFEESGQLNMQMFSEVRQVILDNGVGYGGYDIAVYHGIPGQTELSLQTAIPVTDSLPESDDITLGELPAVEVAYVIHRGNYHNIHQAHGTIQQWMGENGYMPAGAVRDVYLVFDVQDNPDSYVTELQYPIQKI